MNEMHTTSEEGVASEGIASLVTGIVDDTKQLIRQQLALLRWELMDDLAKTKRAILALAAGSIISLVGGILLCLMLIQLLAWALPALPLWACYAIVGVPITGLGCMLLFLGIQWFQSWQALPDQSLQAFKETVQWLRNPRSSAGR